MKAASIGLLVSSIFLVISCNSKTAPENIKEKVEAPFPVVAVSNTVSVDSTDEAEEVAAPALEDWVLKTFRFHQLDKKYDTANFATPPFLAGDFDGDNSPDVALLVKHRKTDERGVLILHQKKEKGYYLAGAGKEVDGMTNLDWIEVFEKIPKGESVARTLVDEETGDIIGPDSLNTKVLKGEGILTHVAEACGGGIIFWNKNKYEWLHIE